MLGRVDSQQLMRAATYKYLGIEFDEALGWQCRVDIICKKVSAGLGALKRIRPLVPSQTLLRMYEALVLPYLDYCSEVLGCNGEKQVWQTAEIAKQGRENYNI